MPVEWVNWENINERHKFTIVEQWSSNNTGPPPTTCYICGKQKEEHWFAKVNPKQLWDEVDQIVDDYNRRLLE